MTAQVLSIFERGSNLIGEPIPIMKPRLLFKFEGDDNFPEALTEVTGQIVPSGLGIHETHSARHQKITYSRYLEEIEQHIKSQHTLASTLSEVVQSVH